MASEAITSYGVILADGSLQLLGPFPLPPGPVEVVVRPLGPPRQGETGLAVLARIRAEQAASGYVPRTAEEIDASIREMRDEWEEHSREIEAIQEECRRQRNAASTEGTNP